MGYSETAFLEAQCGRGQYRVRYFNPQAEVAFNGHATIAAAVANADRGGSGFLRFSTLAGPIRFRPASPQIGLTATLADVGPRCCGRPSFMP